MFCWGDASKGQLGIPCSNGNVSVPTFVNLFPEQVLYISCGEHHTLFLMLSGRVMSCGRNSKGQLGRAKIKDTQLPVIEGLGGVAAIACGQEHSLALCESGQVFSWGGGGEGQLGTISSVAKSTKPGLIQIPSPLPIPVVQVACGNFHSLALSKGGEVFAWGQNKYGQLGLGRDVSSQPVPALVRALTGVPVSQIAAGGAHTLALALPSQVFCCGANAAGQLGLKRTDEKGRFSMCVVPALRRLAVASISCGAEHTAVLTKDGEVYTFGEGEHGQLGHNSTDKELLPRKVKGIDAPAKEVTCGSHHTLILMESGLLLAFGRGVKGQAKNGSMEDSLQPIELKGSWNSLTADTHAEIKIYSGWNSNFLFFPPPKTSVLGNPIGKLDQDQVQRWVSMSEKDINIEKAQREICLTFSTSSNLVACFMKDRGASSESVPGTIKVDLNAASQTFDKLLMIPWIKKAMNITPLVHNLAYAARFMRWPEVFMLLPTCPILHEDCSVIELVLPLAVAITNLNESAMKTLQEHWSSIEPPMMTKHICMWKQALAFLLKSRVWINFVPGLIALLKVLKYLYKANKRGQKQRKVPLSEFYIEEIGSTPQLLLNDFRLWCQIKNGQVQHEDGECAVFCCYPFLLDLQSKISIFNFVANLSMEIHHLIHNMSAGGFHHHKFTGETPTPMIQLKLRRTALLEDTFRQLSSTDHDNFGKQLVVQFAEDSKLTEVNKKDFFLHAFTELLDPDSGIFMYNDTHTMVWFPVKPKVESKRYFLLGILCGMALYNGTIVHLPFPLAMFKKLVNMKPNLEDVIEFSPVLGGSLRYLLQDYTDDDVENMEITFHVNWDGTDVELDPREKGKLVTSANKKEFVDAYVDYILNKSVEKVFEEFRRGFYKVCDQNVVEFFQPEELRGVMVGTEEYDWDTFKKNTVCSGLYHERHPTIIAFWEVFEELTDKQKKAFLLFLTGCERVPIQGMAHVKMTVSGLLNSTQDHLPESLTCHSILMLPEYDSRRKLETKLVMALNHNRGFWKE
ncbi:putative E3 ubiquitin-protein ligase HERC4 [Brachyhypopomus gauderio]|uniref:putative E3 ubiquitin-protein ligase HERC4 n=1 Tax=Brachyhypopomus gauderio TaxID=698409 RepID=UPI00404290C3